MLVSCARMGLVEVIIFMKIEMLNPLPEGHLRMIIISYDLPPTPKYYPKSEITCQIHDLVTHFDV
jgi:hypothetical protein